MVVISSKHIYVMLSETVEDVHLCKVPDMGTQPGRGFPLRIQEPWSQSTDNLAQGEPNKNCTWQM